MVRSDDSNIINSEHQGYDYTPPKVKLCNDGTVRENCDVCPPGTFGTYPDCKKPQCAQGNWKHICITLCYNPLCLTYLIPPIIYVNICPAQSRPANIRLWVCMSTATFMTLYCSKIEVQSLIKAYFSIKISEEVSLKSNITL